MDKITDSAREGQQNTDDELWTNPPTGPVIEAAADELNWLVWQMVPALEDKPKAKPRKMPLQMKRGSDGRRLRKVKWINRADAACMTLDDALGWAHWQNAKAGMRCGDLEGFGIGYLARPGSALVGVDLDACVDGDGALIGRAGRVARDAQTYSELSPSGSGIRLLIGRAGFEAKSLKDAKDGYDHSGMGVYCDDAVFFTVTGNGRTLNRYNSTDIADDRDYLDGLVATYDKFAGRSAAERKKRSAERDARIAEKHADDELIWRTHWLGRLPSDRQREAVAAMLAALPPRMVVDRGSWLELTFALKDIDRRVDWRVSEVWDAWCQTGGNYVYSQNMDAWNEPDKGRDDKITFRSLLGWVKGTGFDPKPWSAEAKAAAEEQRKAELAEGFPMKRKAKRKPKLQVVDAETVAEVETEDDLTVAEDALERLVLHSPTGKVIDLKGPPGYPLQSYTGMARKYGFMDIQSEVTGKWRIFLDSWMRSNDRKATDQPPHLDPRCTPGWVEDGDRSFVNTYRPFIPLAVGKVSEDDRRIDPFLRLVRHVAPEDGDADWLLDWLAYKLQRPWERLTAVVSVTPTFGTGRNTLFEIARRLLGAENCGTINASRLFGSDANQFNSHLRGLLITIGEADENAGGDTRVNKKTFNKLKELVDPNEHWFLLELKGVDGVMVETFASFMIATNAGAGLPLEPGDRRFSVLQGNRIGLREAHPDLTAERNGWIARVRDAGDKEILSVMHAFLMQRDVSGFAPSVPRNTMAKTLLIDNAASPVDRSIEAALDALGSPIFTAGALAEFIQKGGFSEVSDMHIDDLKKQVVGWSKYHSDVPVWLKEKLAQSTAKKPQAKVKVGKEHHFPRIVHGAENLAPALDEQAGKEALERFLSDAASGAPNRLPDADEWAQAGRLFGSKSAK